MTFNTNKIFIVSFESAPGVQKKVFGGTIESA